MYNSLGRAIKAQGRYEEAIPYLQKALKIREGLGAADLDVFVSRDELGVCYQAIGKPSEARAVRLSGGMATVMCSNEPCSKTAGQKGLKSLHKCSRCNCTWYCSTECQKADWKRVHKKICKPWTPPQD